MSEENVTLLNTSESGSLESVEIKYDFYTNMPTERNSANIIPLGITNVRFGSGAPVCEIELNELQELLQRQINCYSSIIRDTFDLDDKNYIFTKKPFIDIDINDLYKCDFGSSVFANICGKVFEICSYFNVPSDCAGKTVYLIAKYDDNINSKISEVTNRPTTVLYRYGYVGSFTSYSNFKSKSSMIGSILDSISLSEYEYLYHSRVSNLVNAEETSRRCGFTYGIITSKDYPSSAENEGYIVLTIGKVNSDGTRVLLNESENTIVTTGLKYHSHVNEEIEVRTANWQSINNNNSAPYSFTVSIPNLTTYRSESPIISLVPNGTTVDEKIAEQDEFSSISEVQVDGSSLTLICYENKPEVDLTINVKVV